MVQMKYIKAIAFSCTWFLSQNTLADVLFEGYSKIMSGDQHIGYTVSRYEFDAKKKQFISTYFLKTGKGENEITESLKAFADAELGPQSYEYTTLVGKEAKTIDASFKAGSLSAVVRENGRVQKIEKKVPKGTFLSTFLIYLMLKSPEGLREETKYDYQAIAEEDASIYQGQASVGKEQDFLGNKALKILNTFKDLKFLSYVNSRGEVLGTNATGQRISTQLVASAKEAIGNFNPSTAVLKTLFGEIPKGSKNILSNASNEKPVDLNNAESTDTAAGSNSVNTASGAVISSSSKATTGKNTSNTSGESPSRTKAHK